jgi:hypothetical protein
MEEEAREGPPHVLSVRSSSKAFCRMSYCLDWVNNLYEQYREWGLPEHRNTYLVDMQGPEMVKN